MTREQPKKKQYARYRAGTDNENGVMSFAEIAKIIGTTEGTIKITYFRAMQKLRTALSNMEIER